VGCLPTSARKHLTADYARSGCGRSILGPGFNSRRLHFEGSPEQSRVVQRRPPSGRRCCIHALLEIRVGHSLALPISEVRRALPNLIHGFGPRARRTSVFLTAAHCAGSFGPRAHRTSCAVRSIAAAACVPGFGVLSGVVPVSDDIAIESETALAVSAG